MHSRPEGSLKWARLMNECLPDGLFNAVITSFSSNAPTLVPRTPLPAAAAAAAAAQAFKNAYWFLRLLDI